MISFHWLADPPWPPGKPVVKDVGRTSLMLNWTKPEHDGGAKIDSYVIEMLKTGTEDWVRVAEGVPTTQHLLPGDTVIYSSYSNIALTVPVFALSGSPSLSSPNKKTKTYISKYPCNTFRF